ncbi:MAG: aminotransferase, partial [Clostridia bacterium]|nr:aminotransferase [Clostridia bacterium]
MNYLEMSRPQLEAEFAAVEKRLKEYAAQGLKFDMTRGKPGAEQLDLSYKLFNQVNTESNFFNEDNTDCRNYGGMDGIIEVKRLFAEILQTPVENVIVG